jgi:hypothetical protein
MKFFIAFAALVAVAVAVPVNRPAVNDYAELEEIIAAINSPSTDPATAALLEQQLLEIVSAANPVAVGPAIIEEHEAAIIDRPLPSPVDISPVLIEPQPELIDLTPVVEEQPSLELRPPVKPEGVVVHETYASSPLVKIIVNVANPSDVATQEIIAPSPVQVIEAPEAEAVIIPEPIIMPSPVQIVEKPTIPIAIIEDVAAPLEPVAVGNPIFPAPVITIPEILN